MASRMSPRGVESTRRKTRLPLVVAIVLCGTICGFLAGFFLSSSGDSGSVVSQPSSETKLRLVAPTLGPAASAKAYRFVVVSGSSLIGVRSVMQKLPGVWKVLFGYYSRNKISGEKPSFDNLCNAAAVGNILAAIEILFEPATTQLNDLWTALAGHEGGGTRTLYSHDPSGQEKKAFLDVGRRLGKVAVAAEQLDGTFVSVENEEDVRRLLTGECPSWDGYN